MPWGLPQKLFFFDTNFLTVAPTETLLARAPKKLVAVETVKKQRFSTNKSISKRYKLCTQLQRKANRKSYMGFSSSTNFADLE